MKRKRTVRLYQVDAFTRRSFAGNPAGVVPEAREIPEAAMQALARELGNSETVFLFPPRGPDHDVWARFFTPATEVPLCGHATLAAHYVRSIEGWAGRSTRQGSKGGVWRVEVEEVDGVRRVWMDQGSVQFGRVLTGRTLERVISALGLPAGDLDDRAPVQHVTTGHGKIIVPITSGAALAALVPDPAALMRCSAEIGVDGFFAFTLDPLEPDAWTEARMFAPSIGILEDPVTGSAHGPLGGYLSRHGLLPAAGSCVRIVCAQGRAVERPGRVWVEVLTGVPPRVRVGGEAAVVFRAEMRL